MGLDTNQERLLLMCVRYACSELSTVNVIVPAMMTVMMMSIPSSWLVRSGVALFLWHFVTIRHFNIVAFCVRHLRPSGNFYKVTLAFRDVNILAILVWNFSTFNGFFKVIITFMSSSWIDSTIISITYVK